MRNAHVAIAREVINEDVSSVVNALDTMNARELRAKYREVFKEDSRSHNVAYLRKRIAYRVQERAYGGLSERAKARIQELVADTPIRRRGLKLARPKDTEVPLPAAVAPKRDPRLPPVGSTLRRQYGKAHHVVLVQEDGFVFRGQKHESLSRIARMITGTSWNGFVFFGLTKPWEAA